MSPELINAVNIITKENVWSIGCVLYEIILLKQAFKCNHIGRLMINIRSGNFNPIKGSARKKDLLKLINLTLETDENKRPTVYDLLLKLPRDFIDKNESSIKEEKKDINLLQDVYIPKSRTILIIY